MKKLTLIALVTLLSFGAFAADGGKKTDDSNKVPNYVIRQFEGEFGDAQDIIWTVTENYDKVEFTVDKVKMAAFYDSNGKYIGHTEAVIYNSLPRGARKQIARDYEGYHVKDLVRFQFADAPTSPLARLTAISAEDDEVYFLSLTKAGKEATLKVSPSSAIEVLSKN